MSFARVSPAGNFACQQEYGARANAFPDWVFVKSITTAIIPVGFAVITPAAFAAGESLTLNVLRGDTSASILTAPLVLDAADAINTRLFFAFSQALYAAIPSTTPLIVDATYVAGGGPANPAVGVFIDIGSGAAVAGVLTI